jgi:hypothetical protein
VGEVALSELEVDLAKTWPELIQETKIMVDVLAHINAGLDRSYLITRIGDLSEAMALKSLIECGELNLEAQR